MASVSLDARRRTDGLQWTLRPVILPASLCCRIVYLGQRAGMTRGEKKLNRLAWPRCREIQTGQAAEHDAVVAVVLLPYAVLLGLPYRRRRQKTGSMPPLAEVWARVSAELREAAPWEGGDKSTWCSPMEGGLSPRGIYLRVNSVTCHARVPESNSPPSRPSPQVHCWSKSQRATSIALDIVNQPRTSTSESCSPAPNPHTFPHA